MGKGRQSTALRWKKQRVASTGRRKGTDGGENRRKCNSEIKEHEQLCLVGSCTSNWLSIIMSVSATSLSQGPGYMEVGRKNSILPREECILGTCESLELPTGCTCPTLRTPLSKCWLHFVTSLIRMLYEKSIISESRSEHHSSQPIQVSISRGES